MYNNLANTEFTGKSIHFLPSCHSTNTEASLLIRSQKAVNGLIVITNEQTAGRGQQGNNWLSEPNSNLTFSVIFFPEYLHIKDSFYLNIVSSLAIAKTIDHFLPQKSAHVKWPNDIYIGNKKVCGILIENTLRGEQINSIVIGIGLNINQQKFSLPNATSFYQESEKFYVLQEVLNVLCTELEYFYSKLEQNQTAELEALYIQKLYGLNILRSFEDKAGAFSGYIRGVNKKGELLIEQESGVIQQYQFKEVRFL